MDSNPGTTALVETEELQLWSSGPDNNHQRFVKKVSIKSTVTDGGNSPTTTLRAGKVLAIKTSDGMAYAYAPTGTDGTQTPVGVVPRYLSMYDRFGVVEDKFSHVLTAGWLKDVAMLLGSDKYAIAVLARLGLRPAQVDPHGSLFGVYYKGRYFNTADYTILNADHGTKQVAITNAVNFTLPDLATVGRGFEVFIYNAVDATMVITAAANTIIYGDAGGALSTTLTFNTANKKMGGQALMVADYGTDGTTLQWYAYNVVGATSA